MDMGLFSRLLGSASTDDGRPPQPEGGSGRKTVDRTRYEATVEYRNGETETFECYGIYSRGDHAVKFNTNPHARVAYDNTPTHSYDRRKINYETLACEPTLEELATDTFVIDFDVTYEWRTPGLHSFGGLDWRETPENVTLSVERDTAEKSK